jgi:hypothetical protein
MKERILFIAIGQAGGNIVSLMEQKNYHCLYINTSYDDLQTIQGRNKYHIPSSYGCSKNRKKAVEYAKDYYNNIIGIIEDKFPQQDIVYFVASLGGGTGSGLIPIISDIISHKNQNKHYGSIVIIPSLNESLQSQINAVEAYNQLTNIKTLKNLLVLDNQKLDKFEINKIFSDQFDRFINITIPHTKGIIDKAELETLLLCRGNVIINDNYTKNIYTEHKYGCKYIAISLNEDTNIEDIRNKYGMPRDMFVGYNDESNFVVAAGLSYPKKAIEKLRDNISNMQNDIEEFNDSINIELPNIVTETKQFEQEVNFKDIFAKYIG